MRQAATAASRRIDISGLTFGRLKVIEYSHTGSDRKAHWRCLCVCGKSTVVQGKKLRSGHTRSCGCARDCSHVTHGMERNGKASPELEMWRGARGRARKQGIPFDIDPQDVIIPERCPVLGIVLECGTGVLGIRWNSPTLDRKVPSLGYIKGNVAVISWRANRLKSDASLEEMRCMVTWMEQ